MPHFDFVILTDDHLIQQASGNAWLEDDILNKALQEQGFIVTRKSWADLLFDWSEAKAVIFRSTWDYFHRASEWKDWLEKVSNQTRLINSIDLIQWNTDKHYLKALQARGIHIPETQFIETREDITLQQLLEQTGWKDTILKPCIAGTARHTYRLNTGNTGAYEQLFQQLIQAEAMMLQPFQHSILTEGEISLMVIGGQFTHAVIKQAKAGDFRVQDDFGGTVALYEPSPNEVAFAEKVVAACHTHPAYARVDIIKDNSDRLALIELELIEPELWFRLNPEAAMKLANYLANTLNQC